jgi:hypothetical protein
MAKMLGNTPYRRYSCFKCRCCGRTRDEQVIYRRNQRTREHAEVRAIEVVVATNARHIPGAPAEDF